MLKSTEEQSQNNVDNKAVDIRDITNIEFEESSVHSSEWDVSEWDRAEEEFIKKR